MNSNLDDSSFEPKNNLICVFNMRQGAVLINIFSKCFIYKNKLYQRAVRGGGGWVPNKKDWRSSEILDRTGKRTKIRFCGCGLNFLSPLGGTSIISNRQLYQSSKAPAKDLLGLKLALRGPKTRF